MELFFRYVGENASYLLELAYEHILMVLFGLLLALLIGVPLGVIAARVPRLANPILILANVIQVFPSMALLVLLMIVFGLGFTSVVIGLFLYSLLPIIRNTYVGLTQVNPALIEAGRGGRDERNAAPVSCTAAARPAFYLYWHPNCRRYRYRRCYNCSAYRRGRIGQGNLRGD